MACRRAATCRARFARGELACVRCAEGKLDVGDVIDLDDEEELPDEECDLDDEDEDEEDEDEELDDVAYTTQPDGMFGAIAYPIRIKGHDVPGIRVTVTEDGEDEEYVIVVEDDPDGLPDDVYDDIDTEVDRYAGSCESLYDVLEKITGRVIELK